MLDENEWQEGSVVGKSKAENGGLTITACLVECSDCERVICYGCGRKRSNGLHSLFFDHIPGSKALSYT